MSKFLKSLKIVGLFLFFTCLVSYVWFRLECSSGGGADCSYIDFIIYLLGYGELEHANKYLRPVFTIISLLSVTLLSSVFTVNLFEWKHKLFLGGKMPIFCEEDGRYTAGLYLCAINRDIYNVNVKLIAGDGAEIWSEERDIPYIPRKSARYLEYVVEPGTVPYRYLRSALQEKRADSVLVAAVSYTDISSGLDYTICRKYRISERGGDFAFCAMPKAIAPLSKPGYLALSRKFDPLTMEEVNAYIRRNIFPIGFATAAAINADVLDVVRTEAMADCQVHFDRRVDFTMLCVSRPLGGDWTAYYDLGCSLKFDLKVSEGLAVTVEIKDFEGGLIMKPQVFSDHRQMEHYSVSLRFCPRERWQQVKEICFTVFYEQVKTEPKTGSFDVSELNLEVE